MNYQYRYTPVKSDSILIYYQALNITSRYGSILLFDYFIDVVGIHNP
jgi:hypothetical protein